MELALRINLLKEIGVEIDKEIKDYTLDVINDWIIYENDMDIECATPCYQMKQFLKKDETI